MATLPEDYDRIALEEQLRDLQQKIDDMKTLITFIPLANPPTVTNQSDGLVAYSDGTVEWVSGAAAKGLYRYQVTSGGSSVWVKIG
tara:strand:- start:829 stop:1086 length:258 start_codon:yes stop_codon:yes gene_type:complete